MTNSWNIPDWLELEVIERGKRCIYCGIDFSIEHTSRSTAPTWEHIVNDARIVTLCIHRPLPLVLRKCLPALSLCTRQRPISIQR